MATQVSYSFIYTTDKLLPFIAARLCLLVIKCDVLQTAPETQAAYPSQIQKYRRQQQHSSVSSQHSSEESFWKKLESRVPSSPCP